MIKKLLCVGLSLILVMGFSGCGDIDEDTGGTLDEDVETTVNTEGDSVILSLFEELQDNEIMPFVLTEKAKVTLAEKENIFTGNRKDGLDELTDTTLEYRALTKNIDKYGDKLLYINEAYVVDISETELDEETVATELQLLDAEENSYYCVSLSAYDNIFEEDIISIYALPIGETSFENVSGGTTLAIMLAGCYIEKCEY